MFYTLTTTDRGHAGHNRGFTLIEILLAISILSVVSVVTFVTFSTAITAWKRGTALAEHLHHGDFVIEQLVMGLRSAYYPNAQGTAPAYGFQTEDNGDGAQASDTISWVKLGSALVGKDFPFAGSPHRVEFTIEQDDEGESAVAVRAWRVYGQTETFSPDDIDPLILSHKITGFNCRSAYRKEDDEIDWLDEWEDTNRLPRLIEITLYVTPVDEGEEPVELKRIVDLPTSHLSW